MRIFLFDFGSELRGGQRQVLYLAKALQKLANDDENSTVHVACLKNSPLHKEILNNEIPHIALSSIYSPVSTLKLKFALKKYQTQIIHTNDAKSATVGSWLKSMDNNIKLIHSRRVSYPLKKGMRAQKYFKADAIIGVSQEISNSLVASGIDAQKAVTIHSGIEPSRYTKKIERNDNRFVFGAIGALTSQKGFNVLISAMSSLSEMVDVKDWEVRIVGSGPLFNDLLEQARQLKCDHKLALLGYQDSTKMLPYFDAMIVPSLDGEGSSGAIKEAWATQIPVVCSNLESNEELVINKVNGLICIKNNPLSLGTSMYQLAQNDELRTTLVKGGNESLKEFTSECMVTKTIDLYRKLLA